MKNNPFEDKQDDGMSDSSGSTEDIWPSESSDSDVEQNIADQIVKEMLKNNLPMPDSFND
jgi:hypothetical protein